MFNAIRCHLDNRQPLEPALQGHQGRPHPAFLALQRRLLACQVELTEAVLDEAARMARRHPGLTIGQFARRMASQSAVYRYSLA